jgi:hypothetical protein
VPAAWGEPARPGFPPEGETGKGKFRLPCCRRHSRSLYYHSSLHNDHQSICQSARSTFLKSCWPRHPLLCRASIRTLNGPRWARCMLGSDLKPRSITTVTDLGWVLPSCERSLKDQSYQTQSPEQGRWMSWLTKTSTGLLAFAPSTQVGYALDLGRLRCCFRCRRALA